MIKARLKGQPRDLFSSNLRLTEKQLDSELATSAKIIESGAKQHMTRQKIFHTGGLRASTIASRVKQAHYVIGTPKNYAQLQEEGATMTPAQLAQQLSQIGGKPPAQSKGVISFRGGRAIWKARPYLIPAFNAEVRKLTARINRMTK